MLKHHCLIRWKGRKKLLFSVEERNNGDLLIYFKHAKYLTSETKKELDRHKEDQFSIKTQKYSVHRSLKSRENGNLIKHTLGFFDKTEKTTALFTTGIKSGIFSPLYIKLSVDLSGKAYNFVNTKKEDFTLIGKASGKISFIYGLFVCDINTQIIEPNFTDVTYEISYFKHFKILLLWSFISSPSIADGLIYHFLSHAGEPKSLKLKKANDKMIEGFTNDEIFDLFIEIRSMMLYQFAEERNAFSVLEQNYDIPNFFKKDPFLKINKA